MIVHQCSQRSPEWYALRSGRLTGSVASKMLSTIKTGEAASRRDLRLRLAVERLTGRPQDDENGFQSEDMRRGVELEPAAIAAYESLTGEMVRPSGFIAHDDLMAGCSLDGHTGDFEGLVSIKCPKSTTMFSYIRSGEFPANYVPQMLHELWITGAVFYDFMAFDDRMPEGLQVFYVRVQRKDVSAKLSDYIAKAHAFLTEVDLELQAVQTMRNLRGQLELGGEEVSDDYVFPTTSSMFQKTKGITLRDYLASQAIPALIQTTTRWTSVGTTEGTEILYEHNPANAARIAYEYADAMLKAREK